MRLPPSWITRKPVRSLRAASRDGPRTSHWFKLMAGSSQAVPMQSFESSMQQRESWMVKYLMMTGSTHWHVHPTTNRRWQLQDVTESSASLTLTQGRMTWRLRWTINLEWRRNVHLLWHGVGKSLLVLVPMGSFSYMTFPQV